MSYLTAPSVYLFYTAESVQVPTLYYEFWINPSFGSHLHSGHLLEWQIWWCLVCHLGKGFISVWKKFVMWMNKWICVRFLFSTASNFLSLSFGSCLCMTNTLFGAVPLSNKEAQTVAWKSNSLKMTRYRLVLLHGETSKVPIVECYSVLKQGRKRKRDSMWSSPVRRRSCWRVPVAMDKVQWKKSKIIDISLSSFLSLCHPVCLNILQILFQDQKHQRVRALQCTSLFLMKIKRGHKCKTFSKRAEQIGNIASITQTRVSSLFVGLFLAAD